MKENLISLEQINRFRYARSNDIEKANELVNQLLSHDIISGSNDYMMAQSALIADYYWANGETEEGKRYIRRAKEFAEYATDRVSLIDVYVLAGNYASAEDDHDEGIKWYFKALDLSLATDYMMQISRIYNNIGTIFIENKDLDKGLEYLLLAEKYSKRYSDTRILATLYNNLLEIYLKISDFEKARHYVELVETHFSNKMSDVERLNYIVNKWKYVLSTNNYIEAENLSKEAHELLEALPNGNDQIMNNLHIFDVLIEMDKADEAIRILEKNIESLKEIKSYHNLKKFYDKLISYYEETDDLDKRNDYIYKSYENDILLQRVRDEQRRSSLSRIDADYKEKEVKRKANEDAYSALSDENLRLLAVNNNLRAIHDIGVKILSTIDLEEIYEILIKKVNELFKVEEFAIGIINESKDALNIKYSGQITTSEMASAEKKLTDQESLSVKCFLTCKEIVINDCELEDPERYARNLARGEKLSSLLFFPIVVNDKPFGIISIQHEQKNAFTSLHIEVFRLLATFASVSFKNAQHNMTLTTEIDKRSEIQNELEKINTQLDYLARHDELTGAFNRRTFERAYIQAFSMAKIHESFLTVMILDIDRFKQYNDYYGHLKGDECIMRVAKTLKKNLKRQQDLVARYGGDEFMILLPDTDREGARHVAMTLVDAIRLERIPHEGSDISDYVTISLGAVSTRVTADIESDTLLIAADNALYKSKRDLGRNAYYLV